MRPVVLFSILITAFLAPDSFGEVTDAAPNGFSLVQEVTIDSSRGDAWKAAVDDVGQWWNDDGTRVTFVYAVGGYHAKGLDNFAAAVDAVVGEALLRLKAYVETGDANNARRD